MGELEVIGRMLGTALVRPYEGLLSGQHAQSSNQTTVSKAAPILCAWSVEMGVKFSGDGVLRRVTGWTHGVDLVS